MPTRTARTGWTGTLEQGVGKVGMLQRLGVAPLPLAEVTEAVMGVGLPGLVEVLVVDYPPEEARELAEALRARDIAPIFLLSPTTPGEPPARRSSSRPLTQPATPWRCPGRSAGPAGPRRRSM